MSAVFPITDEASTKDRQVAQLRIPPHSVEAEQSVLGGLLLDNSAWDRAGDLLTDSDFYRFEHRAIYAAIGALINASKPADVITVFEQLQSLGKAEECGGLVYLNALAQSVPSAANMRRYAEIVRERAVLRKLVATADVFIHSMRGKAIAKLGFDYAAVKALRPDVVYVNCYGYSRRGPEADQPAYDDTIQAECGITHVQGLMNGEPGFVATIMADKVAGLHALYATMMALFHRERTGEGQEVEVTMFEAMASFMLVEHGADAIPEPPLGHTGYRRALIIDRRPQATADGWIAVVGVGGPLRPLLFEALGHAEWTERHDHLHLAALRDHQLQQSRQRAGDHQGSEPAYQLQ